MWSPPTRLWWLPTVWSCWPLAKEQGRNFLFEASVGGGIPVLRPLAFCLAGNRIEEICGILNGTTNYILTKMIRDGEQFDDVLKRAQEKGYAEADPTDDVEGKDACRKICILAALAYGIHVYPEQVYTCGITGIRPQDVACADALGMQIKLFGRTFLTEEGKIALYVFSPPDSQRQALGQRRGRVQRHH